MATSESSVEHDRTRQPATHATERVTYRETRAVVAALESLVEEGRYPNRSEAIRAATRQLVCDDLGDELESGYDGA